MHLVFGQCEFDSLRHVLLRHGRPTPLSPRAFRLLELLLDRRPEVISKSEIIGHLWPGTFVTDASLHNLVAEVRAATGDTPRAPRFIRTVSRLGYGFHGDARPASERTHAAGTRPSGPQLVSRERAWNLLEGSNVLGRDHDCAVAIDSPGVSRQHARVVVTHGEATVEDLGSKNGTYVDGRRVNETTRLADGSQVRVGPVTMVYRLVRALPSTVTERQK